MLLTTSSDTAEAKEDALSVTVSNAVPGCLPPPTTSSLASSFLSLHRPEPHSPRPQHHIGDDGKEAVDDGSDGDGRKHRDEATITRATLRGSSRHPEAALLEEKREGGAREQQQQSQQQRFDLEDLELGVESDASSKVLLAVLVCSAVGQNDLKQVRSLVSGNRHVLAADYDQRWPLHIAASQGHLEMVEMLVNMGHPIDVVDRWGNTSLFESIANDYANVSKFLGDAGGSIIRPSVWVGAYLCELASSAHGASRLRSAITHAGMDPSSGDYDGRTALHIAVQTDCVDTARILLQLGASVYAQDRWGQTPRNCPRTTPTMAAMLKEVQRDTPETETDTHDDIVNGGNSSVDKTE